MRARALALAAALLGCRERYRPEVPRDAGSPGEVAQHVEPDVPDAPPAPPRATLRAPSGAVAVDVSLRLAADGGVSDVAAADGLALEHGDQLALGPGASAAVEFPSGTRAALAGEAAAEVPGHAGASLVVTRGLAELVAPMESAEALRVDTPAGRVIVSAGRAWVAVADDGAVRVAAAEGAVTAWPSPPPPPERATRLSAAERRRLALASPGHPLLLDVDLPELAAAEVRPASSRALANGESLAWGPDGTALAGALPRLAGDALRASLERWVARRDAALPRRDGHLAAVEALSRAGAGDVADLRVAVARLRTRPPATERERAELLGRMSLALGRLGARARRGRALATRGGDVTALVQTAPFEELRQAALAWAPPR